jgi:pectate lyase
MTSLKVARLMGAGGQVGMICACLTSGLAFAAEPPPNPPARAAAPSSPQPADTPSMPRAVDLAVRQPDAWFSSPEGEQVLRHVLSHQSARGDWPKNTPTTATDSSRSPQEIQGTFDNGATTGELRLLARAARLRQAQRPEYLAAFLKGLDHILAAQYTNGGWPQYSPPPAKSYHRHITFNDGTGQRLLELMRDVGQGEAYFFLDPARRAAARAALARGLDCVLRCQITVNGAKTVWCAQHDEVSLAPRGGRAYELPSLSGAESAGLLLFLMSLEAPSPAVIDAVTAGVAWFDRARLTGLREIRVNGDKRLEPDRTAPPLWARFYDLETGRPIYCGRDGIKRFDFAAIEGERRNGYAWHGRWGTEVFDRYQRWAHRRGPAIPSIP